MTNPAMTNETLTRAMLNVRPACSCGNCLHFAASHFVDGVSVGRCRWPWHSGNEDAEEFNVNAKTVCDKWEGGK